MKPLVLITGGTRGIGAAVASLLSKEDYDLILTYNSNDERAEVLKDSLEGEYRNDVYLLKADSTQLQSIDLIEKEIERIGRNLRGVILNAGITDRSTFSEMTFEDWNRVFMANIHFPTFLLQRLENKIRTHGSIIFTGSSMGIYPHSVSLSYGVTKSAVHALVKNLVKFFAGRDIRVNAVAPGFVLTEWQKEKPQHIIQNICNKVAKGRFAEPDEIAEAFFMLLNNPYINGEILSIDGGYSYK
ncbi:MAG TPA: short-chain dehydrogenase [Porphyromonadaceae bacterium]|nr:short-chain dehydrogenase [Porphyromonadaceae bacterium]